MFKLQELIGLIRHTKIPIICMCNDRNHPKIRSLVHYCFDLRFQRPRLEQIKVKMAAWLILNYQQQSYLCVAQFIENWKTLLETQQVTSLSYSAFPNGVVWLYGRKDSSISKPFRYRCPSEIHPRIFLKMIFFFHTSVKD